LIVKELREHIEARGYEVRRIRVFKNSFHVNYWSPNAKMRAFYKSPIEKVTWQQIEGHYPKAEE